MFRLALLVLAVLQLQSAFALDCPLCASFVGWYDCARTAVVQNCSQHDPIEDKSNRTLFCYQLELMEPSSHAAHFQQGCTSEADFCTKESSKKDVRHCSLDRTGNFTDDWQISNKTEHKIPQDASKLTTPPNPANNLPHTEKLVDNNNTLLDTTAPSVTEKGDHALVQSTTKKSMPSEESAAGHSASSEKVMVIFPTIDPKYLAGNGTSTTNTPSTTAKPPINGSGSNCNGSLLRMAQLLVAICVSRWMIH